MKRLTKWVQPVESKKEVRILMNAEDVELLYRLAGQRKDTTGQVVGCGLRLIKALGDSGERPDSDEGVTL